MNSSPPQQGPRTNWAYHVLAFALLNSYPRGGRKNSDCSAPLGFSVCRSCRRKISGSFAFSQSRSASNHPILLAFQCALGLQLLIGSDWSSMFHPKKNGRQAKIVLPQPPSQFSNQPNEVWSTIGHSGSWQADKRGQRDLQEQGQVQNDTSQGNQESKVHLNRRITRNDLQSAAVASESLRFVSLCCCTTYGYSML